MLRHACINAVRTGNIAVSTKFPAGTDQVIFADAGSGGLTVNVAGFVVQT